MLRYVDKDVLCWYFFSFQASWRTRRFSFLVENSGNVTKDYIGLCNIFDETKSTESYVSNQDYLMSAKAIPEQIISFDKSSKAI